MNWHRLVSWIKDDLVQWRIYMSLGPDVSSHLYDSRLKDNLGSDHRYYIHFVTLHVHIDVW